MIGTSSPTQAAGPQQVLTIEAYERIADLVEEADDVLEVERRMQDADFLSLEEVKTSLGLHDPD